MIALLIVIAVLFLAILFLAGLIINASRARPKPPGR